jgi:hypothetical protein
VIWRRTVGVSGRPEQHRTARPNLQPPQQWLERLILVQSVVAFAVYH